MLAIPIDKNTTPIIQPVAIAVAPMYLSIIKPNAMLIKPSSRNPHQSCIPIFLYENESTNSITPRTIAHVLTAIGISIADANGFHSIIKPSNVSSIPDTKPHPHPWFPDSVSENEIVEIPEARNITPRKNPTERRAAPGFTKYSNPKMTNKMPAISSIHQFLNNFLSMAL